MTAIRSSPGWNCRRRSVMMMVVVVDMVVLMNSRHAFYAANNAPGDSTDSAANRAANGASRAPTRAPAFGGASLATLNNALSLRSERHRKSSENNGFDQAGFHEQT